MPDKPESNVVRLTRQPVLVDDAPIEEIYEQNRSSLIKYLEIRLGSQAEAQDIAQAAFAKLWEKREQLHRQNLTALLFVTARNLANDFLRRQRRQQCHVRDELAVSNVSSTVVSPDRIAAGRREIEIIRKLLNELPEKCRHAFIRYKFDALGYDEIAREMNVSESMIRKHVIRAVAHCSSRLAEMEEWV